MTTRRSLTTVLALCGLVTAQSAIGIEAQESVADERTISEGKALYASVGLCFACHGPTGQGVPGAGPNLSDGDWLHSDGSLDGIFTRILTGVSPSESKSGVIMPPKGGSAITEEQARSIAAYVWSLQRRTF